MILMFIISILDYTNSDQCSSIIKVIIIIIIIIMLIITITEDARET